MQHHCEMNVNSYSQSCLHPVFLSCDSPTKKCFFLRAESSFGSYQLARFNRKRETRLEKTELHKRNLRALSMRENRTLLRAMLAGAEEPSRKACFSRSGWHRPFLWCANAAPVSGPILAISTTDRMRGFHALRDPHPGIDRAKMRAAIGDLMARYIVEFQFSFGLGAQHG